MAGCAWRSAGRLAGQDAFEGALAHPAHGRVALGVVPDCSHGLLEGPCLAALPFEIVAAEVVAEYLPWPWLEQVPGANKIQSGVGRSEAADVQDPGQAPAGYQHVARNKVAMGHRIRGSAARQTA